jgi:NitT/TauT family transport system ATP-binding protein
MATESSSHAVDPQLAVPAPVPLTPAGSRVGVEFKGVQRHFGTVAALKGLDMEIHPGELVALLGPSGCGKTTALRLLAGFDRPDAGTITVGGRNVTKVATHKRDMGMVFQAYSLFPNMSVRQNVAFGLRMRRRAKADRLKRADELLEMVGLSDAGDRYPYQLSGGQQQRVAIARALACDPVLLLMDEPFGSVDAQTREDLEDLILAVRRERDITILLVTHDIDESVYVGDRVVVLSRGPGQIRADLPVDLPSPRDQITTRELAAFVHLRAEVGRLVRGQQAPGDQVPGDQVPGDQVRPADESRPARAPQA